MILVRKMVRKWGEGEMGLRAWFVGSSGQQHDGFEAVLHEIMGDAL